MHTEGPGIWRDVDAGYMDEAKLKETSEWALVRIYQIQNNSRVLRAAKIYNELTD